MPHKYHMGRARREGNGARTMWYLLYFSIVLYSNFMVFRTETMIEFEQLQMLSSPSASQNQYQRPLLYESESEGLIIELGASATCFLVVFVVFWH